MTDDRTRERNLVLIVEDSRSIFSGLKRAIEKQLDFRIEVVSTYDDAKAFLQWHAKDVFIAILDLNLPGAPDGEIVDLFCSMAVPSIVFTSDLSEETRSRMLSKEIVDYVIKDSHAVRNLTNYIERLHRNTAIKVLVVEDSDSFRLAVCALLYKQMFQVVDFIDAESALEFIAKDGNVGLVITDYELPGMNGVEFTKTVRTQFGREDVPIIGLSSSTDPMLTARFIKSGANDFLAKPFEAEEFNCRISHNVEIQETVRALREANTVKNQFLGMAVHDLRSPISGINGLAEMLMDGLCGPLNDEQREMIGFIHSANRYMNSMVNDLLDFSVIEAGKLRLMRSESDLVEVIKERLRIHSLAAKKKTISLIPDLVSPGRFSFDGRRIGQVIDNLMTNAIKFSPTGSTIDIKLEGSNGVARVCIRDHGQGIPPGEEALLFQSFAITSILPTGGETSTGLGLPIVKKIVECHGGEVWVESEFGDGAMFCFTLPMD